MNKLDFSISLREKGLDSVAIKKKMKENGFEDSEIQYYFKKSDEIFLNQYIRYKASKSEKSNRNLKMMTLLLSLLLLSGVFFGYVSIGLIGLFIMWTLVGYSSYRK